MIDVSIIMPIYNAMKTLPTTMPTILAQTWKDTEIICVDDGSTDGTAAWLDELAGCEKKVRVIHQVNAGAGAARNAGLKAARGRYVTFWDADDLFEPQLIEHAIQRADKTNAQMVVYALDRHVETDNGVEIRKDIDSPFRSWQRPDGAVFSFRDIGGDTPYGAVHGFVWDKLFEKKWIEERGIAFGDARYMQDASFLYAVMFGMERITVMDEILVHYQVTRENATSSFNRGSAKALACVGLMSARVREKLVALGAGRMDLIRWDSYALRHFQGYLMRFRNLDESFAELLRLIRDEWLPQMHVDEWSDKDYLRVPDRLFVNMVRYCDAQTMKALLPTLHEAGVESTSLRIQLNRRSAALQREQANNQILTAANREMKIAADAVRNSRTYKIGEALTKVPRALRDSVKDRK